jgi:molecular chaperone DnaJ
MGAFGGGGDSIFDSFCGGEESPFGHGRQGASKKISITISFEEAAKGVEKEAKISNNVVCPTCQGSGATSPSAIQTCQRCNGHGQVIENRGFFSMSMTCPQCEGTGQVITDPCRTCHGKGKIKEKQHVKIRIPAGIDTGMRLKMSGYGDAGEGGGPNEDLYVYVNVEDHEIFDREGDNVILTLPVSLTEASLGCKKEIPTIGNSTVRITVAPGTQTGKVLRIRGEGFPNVHGRGKGDMLVQVIVETPTNLSSKQKELLEEFQKLESPKNSPRQQGFMDKIKGFFCRFSEN